MDSLIVYPENNDQLVALKAVMKAMKISFEQKGDTYPEHVIKGIKESLQQSQNGTTKPFNGMKDMIENA